MPGAHRLAALLVTVAAATPLGGARLEPDPSASQEPSYSRDWIRVHSPHFVAAGNTGFAEMRAVLLELEGFRGALLRTVPGLRVASPRPTTVVVFRDERAFAPFRPASGGTGEHRARVAGYFLTTREASYMVVAVHRDMRRTFQHLFHEYTHFIVQQNLGRVPHWLNEGLAEYYSTLRADLRAGRSILGEPSPPRIATLSRGGLLPLAELLAFDASGGVPHPAERTATFYAQSWALVHYLLHGEGGRLAGGVAPYLGVERAGGSIEEAVRAGFGLELDELEQRLVGYIRRGNYTHTTLVEPAGTAPARIAREAMPERDVDELLDTLRAALSATGAGR